MEGKQTMVRHLAQRLSACELVITEVSDYQDVA